MGPYGDRRRRRRRIFNTNPKARITPFTNGLPVWLNITIIIRAIGNNVTPGVIIIAMGITGLNAGP
jgi:hypothetical protein